MTIMFRDLQICDTFEFFSKTEDNFLGRCEKIGECTYLHIDDNPTGRIYYIGSMKQAVYHVINGFQCQECGLTSILPCLLHACGDSRLDKLIS